MEIPTPPTDDIKGLILCLVPAVFLLLLIGELGIISVVMVIILLIGASIFYKQHLYAMATYERKKN